MEREAKIPEIIILVHGIGLALDRSPMFEFKGQTGWSVSILYALYPDIKSA